MAPRRFLLLTLTLLTSLIILNPAVAQANSITSPDTAGDVGEYASLALDGEGNPVVSYYDLSNTNLKILHCNDAGCAGGEESITSPDAMGDAPYGANTSLALDSDGYPVVSYYDYINDNLKVMHCNDANCYGGGENITSPDTAGHFGGHISLVLDGDGHPVISYHDGDYGDLKIMHCNDPNCDGGGESITSFGTAGQIGWHTSLALDGDGNPVVSYTDVSDEDLKIMHCNDPNCDPTVGGPESITSPDTIGFVGYYTSLALDRDGHPVVTYYHRLDDNLKVMHCNDANCTGEDESITSPDTVGDVGAYTSLTLDGDGNPVVTYYDATNGDLKVMHCDDANCAGSGESILTVDREGDVGQYTSLALDAAGYPVVSYYDATNGDLKLLHCSNPECASVNGSITSPDTEGSVGQHTSLALDGDGNPLVSYYDATNADLKIMHCNDANCAAGGEAFNSPDTEGTVGNHTSLALDGEGYPVVSYYDPGLSQSDLKLLHCNDPHCAGGDESITTPDTVDNVGQYTSLALDADGFPVISYHDMTSVDLKVLHCNDPNCAGGDENVTSPDTGGSVGRHTSLALDGDGYPVVSYYDFSNADLKVMHCNDPNCAGDDESITSPDSAGSVGTYTSLALDGAGNPVVSYYDTTNDDLKVLHCNDPNCAGDDESITSPDTAGSVGEYTSLALDGAGNPVVSYYDQTNGDLKLLHCNDPNCAGNDEIITSPDTAGAVGSHTSLALDANGYPVVSYYDNTSDDLKILHCFNPDCSLNVAPQAMAGPDQTVNEGEDVLFAGSASDPDGDPLTIHWAFGDGATAEDTLTPQHAYADDGNFTVTLTVTDTGGLADGDTLLVTVHNVAPTVDAGPDVTAAPGEAVSFSGSFSDPGTADTHTIGWDFGDGSTTGVTLTPQHAYAQEGVYTVTLMVTDDDGGVGSDSLMVTVGEGQHRLYLPLVLRYP